MNLIFASRAKEFETPTHKQASFTRLSVSLLCDEDSENILLIHPAWAHQYSGILPQLKDLERLVHKGTKLSVLSTGELSSRLTGAQRDRRKMIEDEWEGLRRKVYLQIQYKWPIVTLAINTRQMSEADRLLHDAEADLQFGRFEISIGNVGKAVEFVLRALYGERMKQSGRVRDEEGLTLSDMLNFSKSQIEEQYGENVWSDLNFIRTWRNPASHATEKIPTFLETKNVLRRGQLFLELVKGRLAPR